MFLKRIEMQGFKSFADKTIISFEHPLTGIVGPNGCGKSNITDAVRWVLGEQSAKSLRGDKMNDVIFAGSADRRKVNMAEVTLVFDNTSKILHDERDELEVTRRLFRDSGEAEYLINRRNVRLKDIIDLFLDTGLGRDSLSIISQGNVLTFAEAKPYERRGIFEEAAGVAKFKKRKLESISKLQRTTDNLQRLTDVLNELEKQVSPLKRQARKAEIYREKKKRLEEIEISVLVQDIEQINLEIESAKKTLFDIEARTAMYNTSIQVSELKIQEGRDKIKALDHEIAVLQDELLTNYNDVAALEARKTELDERRKYIVQTGDDKQKAKELRELLDTAKLEYENRKERLDTLNNELKLFTEKLSGSAQRIIDATSAFERESGLLRSFENRKNVLDQLIRSPFNNMSGVRAIMESRNALRGILGVVGQVFEVENGYEQAISTALGGAMNYIITTDESAARDAIRFLNRNQSGRATFQPLDIVNGRYVAKDSLIICENTKGFLGVASQFVHNEPKFDMLASSLLGNVLVVDTMETGNELSARTKRMYKIVTLNGEVIHRGGSMTGGKTKNDTNIVTMRKEAQDIERSIDSQKAKVAMAKKALDSANSDREIIARGKNERTFAIASLEPVVEAKKAKYEKLRNDYSLLNTGSDIDETDAHADELVIKLNGLYSRRDEITTLIRTKREERQNLDSDNERKSAQLKQVRKDLATAEAAANAIRIDQSRLETNMENYLQRLTSEYKLTFEFARTKVSGEPVENAKEEVAALRSDIERLGNINMNAPEEYNEVNQRYEDMKKNIAELSEARDKILAVIDELDGKMKFQFKDMFDKINHEFNDIFRSLYGGGKATLILDDPNDLLNTGIDIDAQPPGKAVQNNKLFSGGEKSLIALCVLFAILKVKPVPLVILDEVEAALDPGNVERFAQYLHNYTDRTQFIVVTHRPGTMENTDVLFGVTMQHQGVSQMLKVELREAIDMAEPTVLEAVS